MTDTRGAGQLVVVTADPGATTATLRTFERRDLRGALAAVGCWRPALPPAPAYIGESGFSHRISEGSGVSPIGSFTLTEAFGNVADPGSGLPYRLLRVGDVWVDDPSAPAYNTLQADNLDGHKGSGERLWRERRAYAYAVVIDYNRSPVIPGAGSAIFLHVATGGPTAGCVAIGAGGLVAVLRWLRPAARPRIAMGPLADVLAM